jgi:dTDP-4-dehydrorhamnose reductase
MNLLIGSTGFVGSHLRNQYSFEYQVHRPNVSSIRNGDFNLVVCAGLPAEKWKVEKEPESDWQNLKELAGVISTITAKQAVLISSIDIFQNASNPTELTFPDIGGEHAYGNHRAWFEMFFRTKFPNGLIVRLPGLFATDVRKNFVHDLLNDKQDQYSKINGQSQFQYFDITQTWSLIAKSIQQGLTLLNVATEPVFAYEIAKIFDVELKSDSKLVRYTMQSIYSELFGGHDGYLRTSSEVLNGIKNIALSKP